MPAQRMQVGSFLQRSVGTFVNSGFVNGNSPGNLIVLLVYATTTVGGETFTVSDTIGNVYTQVYFNEQNNSIFQASAIYICAQCLGTSSANTVRVDLGTAINGGNIAGCIAVEYGNAYPSVAIRGAGSFSVGSGSQMVLHTATQPGDLVVTCTFNNPAFGGGPVVPVFTTGAFSNVFTPFGANAQNQLFGDALANSTDTVANVAYTGTAGNPPITFGIAFKNFKGAPSVPINVNLRAPIDVHDLPDGPRIVSQTWFEDYTVSLAQSLTTDGIGTSLAAAPPYVLNLANLPVPLSQIRMLLINITTMKGSGNKLWFRIDVGNGFIMWRNGGNVAGDSTEQFVIPILTSANQVSVTVYNAAAAINTTAINLAIGVTNFDCDTYTLNKNSITVNL